VTPTTPLKSRRSATCPLSNWTRPVTVALIWTETECAVRGALPAMVGSNGPTSGSTGDPGGGVSGRRRYTVTGSRYAPSTRTAPPWAELANCVASWSSSAPFISTGSPTFRNGSDPAEAVGFGSGGSVDGLRVADQ